MSLNTLLREAAPTEAGFDADDVERRVQRVRRRHRAVAGLCGLALVVGGTAAALVLLGQENDPTVVAGPPQDEHQPVPITEAALVGSRWIQLVEGAGAALWLEFGDDGRAMAGGCGGEGPWSVEEGQLTLDLQPSRLVCLSDTVLAGEATLFDDGLLRFRSTEPDDATTIELRRLDALGSVPSPADLEGSWVDASTGLTLTFGEVLTIGGCLAGPWYLTGGDLEVAGTPIGPSCQSVVSRGTVRNAERWLVSLQGLRVVDDRLLLSSEAEATWLERRDTDVDPALLTTSPWVLVGDDGELDPSAHLEYFGEPVPIEIVGAQPGDFRFWTVCDGLFGRWTLLPGPTIHHDVDRHVTGYCVDDSPSTDDPVFPPTVPEIAGNEMTFREGNTAVTYRRPDPADAITGRALIGNWRTEDGEAFRIQADGGVEVAGCEMGTWRVDRVGELGLDVSVNACPESAGLPRLVNPSITLRVWRDGDQLVLFRPGTLTIFTAGPATMSVNEAELLLLRAYEEMGVEQCCAEPSEGGQNAVVGFVWEETDVFVRAAPYDPTLDVFGDQVLGGAGVMNEGESGTEVIVVCGRFHVTLHEALPGFAVPDAVLIAAAEALFAALDCSLD